MHAEHAIGRFSMEASLARDGAWSPLSQKVPSKMDSSKKRKIRAVACCGITVILLSLSIVRCIPLLQIGREWYIIAIVATGFLMEKIATVFDPSRGDQYTWVLQLTIWLWIPMSFMESGQWREISFPWLNLCTLIPIVVFEIAGWLVWRAANGESDLAMLPNKEQPPS